MKGHQKREGVLLRWYLGEETDDGIAFRIA